MGNLKSGKVKKASCIAVLGTGSDVGKSIVTTALCRVFAEKGLRVAPFKAQNMSNNSGVTPEGAEMGRAQIVQAEAAGLAPHVDMNPILLKPTTETGAQIVLLGRAVAESTALAYHKKKEQLFSTACAALDRLREKFDIVILEGAGSCAEVNLMENDIVNLRMAEYADAPVILVADIHKGGVFAQILGTLACLDEKHKERIAGFVINRFRGDIRLFEDGICWIEEKTRKKVFGVLPWFHHINIEAEDSVVIERPESVSLSKDVPTIAIIRLPHISNFTDFHTLSGITGLQTCFVEKVRDLSTFSAVVLPGSKNTRFDLNWLNTSGWSEKIIAYAEQGGHVLGICGGYQMMGSQVHDPDGLDGKTGTTEGLRLLPVETTLKAPKTTTLTDFSWEGITGRGYEIHMGNTKRTGGSPFFNVHKRNGFSTDDEDGCVATGLKQMGTYMHGLFDVPGITKKWLHNIGLGNLEVSDTGGLAAREKEYGLLAEHFEKYVDMNSIDALNTYPNNRVYTGKK